MSYDPYERFIEPFDGHMIPEQLEAAERLVKDEENDFFVTGRAGSGKSYLVRALRSIIPISVCSTTAMSAINVGGVTVDRMFNFSRDDWKVRSRPKLDEIMRETAPNILIDEASMIGFNMAEPIYSAARRYRKRLILVGDMAQASPVKDTWGTKHKLFLEAERITLKHCHRQTDSTYLDALNKLRFGVVDDSVRAAFKQCIDPSSNAPDDYIRLFGTNAMADDYNSLRFNKLPQKTPATTLTGNFVDLRSNQNWEIGDGEIKRAYEGARIAHDEWMMIGARVLIGVNDLGGRFVNGDAGIVTQITMGDGKYFSESTEDRISSKKISHITVLLDRTGEEVDIGRIERVIVGPTRQPMYQVIGFPIKLGWAHTVHKAQGMTLQHAYVSLSSIARGFRDESRHGVGYVGLSRTTSLAGLRIDSWVDEAIYSSADVKDFL